jgi:hypothetical protein
MKLSYDTFKLLIELNDREADEIQEMMHDCDNADSRACYRRADWTWYFKDGRIVLDAEY